MSGEAQTFLYHYTSINTLGLILKNKSIKFNSLEKMDDLDEKIVLNKELGKYTFVSCWTNIEEESIPMWKMYSDDFKGIRIKLPKNPFKVYIKDGEKYIIDVNDIVSKDYYYYKPYLDSSLRSVDYKSLKEVEEKKNEIGKEAFNYFGYDPYLVGLYKSDYWTFQHEWRYILFVVPSKNPKEDIKKGVMDEDYIVTLPNINLEAKYLSIDENAIKQMEITLGPKTNEIDKKIVELLLKDSNLNKDVKIQESILKGRI